MTPFIGHPGNDERKIASRHGYCDGCDKCSNVQNWDRRFFFFTSLRSGTMVRKSRVLKPIARCICCAGCSGEGGEVPGTDG
jgi:hypothetical protein